MKRFIFAAVLIALILVGYRIYNYVPPPVKRRAPPGTCYLTEYVSARTPTGVVGLVPGDEVRIVNNAEASARGRRVVTEGLHEFEVSTSFLTDDLDVAERLGGYDKDRQKKAALAAYSEKLAADHSKRKADIEMARKAEADIARLHRQ